MNDVQIRSMRREVNSWDLVADVNGEKVPISLSKKGDSYLAVSGSR